jgi:DNA replication protein DnaD
MNTSHGWIKLYRCLLDDPIWQCSTNEQKIILVTLLLMANHAEAKWQWNGTPFHCQPGQMVTSLKSIYEKCGKRISVRKIQLALIRFEKMGFLLKQTSHINTLITICNWTTYQSREKSDVKEDVKAALNPCQTTVTPALTNKNVKNKKNLSLREEDSFKDDFSNDPLVQETLRKAKEYDDEQKRICEMFQRTNP